MDLKVKLFGEVNVDLLKFGNFNLGCSKFCHFG